MSTAASKSPGLLFNRIILLVSLSAILVLALGAFALRSLSNLNSGSEWAVHAQSVRVQLSHVMAVLMDMGSGLRRFELTHDEQSFVEAEAAAVTLPTELAELHRMVARDPGLPEMARRLDEAAQDRQRMTTTLIAMARAGDVEGVRNLISRGENVSVLNACRAAVAQMQDAEDALFRQHSESTAEARTTVLFAVVSTTGLAVILLMLVAYVTMRHTVRVQGVQNELSTTLRSIGDAVISTDAQGRVRFMNTVAEQLTGWSSAEAVSRPLGEVFRIVSEHTREPVESPVRQVLRERTVVGLGNRTLLIGRHGNETPIEDSGSPILDPDDHIVGVVLVFRDASSEREAERALLDSAAALREADQRKDVFLATLSHELRNPLAPIRNAARLLESPTLTNAELDRSRMIISRQVRHMASLLDDLLDVSRITRGALTLKRDVVHLKTLFEAAIETARPALDAKRHVLDVDWPAPGLQLDADPVRLTQVVTNLLTNAAKYTDPEGRITLGWRLTQRTVALYVRDNGIGIAPEMLTKVFEMFSQVEPVKGHADGGLGIGLALVKGLVELHGGRVEAHSDGLEKGSEFVVSFPDSLIDVGSTPVETVPVQDVAATRPLRLLIADDNRDSAESLGMLLELSGHEIYLAHTGLDALAMASDKKPDAALLDIGMPGMDGYQVAANIRREPWGEHMTLIAITGWGQEDNKRMAREAGFDHHLTKPMDSAVLERLLEGVARPA